MSGILTVLDAVYALVRIVRVTHQIKLLGFRPRALSRR
jgi:hypothetical protein